MNKNLEIYNTIEESLKSSPSLSELNKKGMCRIWAREAIGVISNLRMANSWDIQIEAREVEIEPGLDHTFLRVITEDMTAFVFDGTGAGYYDPFFGPEDEATHLQNSKLDWIHYLLLANVN